MKNLFLALLFSLSIAASASASSKKFDKCDVVGSYINQLEADLGPPVGVVQVLTQLQLHSDGTAYFNQTTALNFPISTGTFAPSIGTWKLKKCRILVTFINWAASPVTNENCCDVNTSDWYRLTQEYRFVNKNTIERIHSVDRVFDTTEDPLTASGTVISDVTTVRVFNRIPVVASDLN